MSTEKNWIENVLKDVVDIVEQAKKQVVVQANSSLTLMFWQIGRRIRTENLEGTVQNMVRKSLEQFQLNWWVDLV